MSHIVLMFSEFCRYSGDYIVFLLDCRGDW